MLDKYEEINFVNQLSLPRSKKSGGGILFECVFCKEGKSQGKKRRAYILMGNAHEHVRFFCHNCELNYSLKKFLEEYDNALFEEYKEREKQNYINRLKENKLLAKRREVKKHGKDKIQYYELGKKYFIRLAENKEALSYCKNRKIPGAVLERLFYCPENSKIPEKFRQVQNMVIFPFYHGDKMYGFQGRSIIDKRFWTKSQPGWKVYNIFNIKNNNPVYICESIIDSLFIHNSISMLGSDVSFHSFEKIKEPIFLFDNDFTSKTFDKLEKYIDLGYKVIIWPEEIKQKDINQMIMEGISQEEIQNIVESNIFDGFKAQTKLKILKTKKRRM